VLFLDEEGDVDLGEEWDEVRDCGNLVLDLEIGDDDDLGIRTGVDIL
jgi:hypothetical protein